MYYYQLSTGLIVRTNEKPVVLENRRKFGFGVHQESIFYFPKAEICVPSDIQSSHTVAIQNKVYTIVQETEIPIDSIILRWEIKEEIEN